MEEKTAVILIGGKSSRMGRDKSLIEYHGMPQKKHLVKLLKSIDFTTFLAGREEQKNGDSKFLVDEALERGPVSGILSALKMRSTGSVLVLCCDQPLINSNLIQFLWDKAMQAEEGVLMSCFESEAKPGVAEPFPSVWSASSRDFVEQAMSRGHYRVRDILSANQVALHRCPDYSKLININTPCQWQSWRKDHVLG